MFSQINSNQIVLCSAGFILCFDPHLVGLALLADTSHIHTTCLTRRQLMSVSLLPSPLCSSLAMSVLINMFDVIGSHWSGCLL